MVKYGGSINNKMSNFSILLELFNENNIKNKKFQWKNHFHLFWDFHEILRIIHNRNISSFFNRHSFQITKVNIKHLDEEQKISKNCRAKRPI